MRGEGQLIRDQQRRERRTDLGRVNAAGYQDDGLALLDQLPRGRVTALDLAWVRELVVDRLVLFELPQILRARYRRVNERCTHRRLADLFELHAVACRVQLFEIINDLRPTGEFSVVARREAERVFRRRDRLA